MDRSTLFYMCVILTYYILWLNDVEGKEEDFNGMRFRMAAETWVPYVLLSEESGGVSYSGIMPKILDYLQVSLNFTTSLARPPDGGWGAIDDRGNWGGMVGMVKRNEVDFALGPFGLTWLRSQVVDYSLPIVVDDMTGFLSLELSKDHGILYRAFGWRVWLAVVIITPLFIAILGLSDWLYSGQTTWWSYIEFCLRSICMHSVTIPQNQNYNQIYSLAWIWSSFVLFTAYQGTLVSLITKPKQPELLSSVHELVRQDEMPWLIEAGSGFTNMGNDAEEGTTLKRFSDGAIAIPGTCTSDDYIKRLKSGKYSAVCDKLTIQKAIHDDYSSTGKCNFYYTPTGLLPLSIGMIFQKQSFLLGPVNEKLHTLLSTGLIDKWIQDVVANSSNCETVSKMVGSHQSSEQRPFSLEEMASFFFIILIGHFMATLGFALEAIKKGCSG